MRIHLLAAGMLVVLVLAGCGGGGGDGGETASDPYAWQRHASNPLLISPKDPPPATTFEYSIADPSVRYDAAAGLWKAWYSATRFDTSIPGDPGVMIIRYAESSDGVAWTVQTAPVLQARNDPGDWDYTHTETPSVVENPDPAAPASQRWLLFYSGGNRDADIASGRTSAAADGYPYYQIGLAYSADGRSFTRCTPGIGGRPGLALTADQALGSLAGYGDGMLADPEAVVQGGEVRLWFTSYAETVDAGGRTPIAFGIGHARSADAIAWTFPPANPLASLYRPSELGGGSQPAVIYDPALGRFEMWFRNDTPAEELLLPTSWFTAYAFRHATSADGITWTPDYTAQEFAWKPSKPYEAYGMLTGCAVVRHGGTDRMYFSSWGTQGIPDPVLYQVPLQVGGMVPAVISFNLATRRSPPGAVTSRRNAMLPLARLGR